jgi:hypothetical protein
MQNNLPILIRLSDAAADQREQLVSPDITIADLIIYCKKDYCLPEQDCDGEMVRYALYRKQGNARAILDKNRTLRTLRIQPYEVLYLASERHPWWQSNAARPSGRTAPLRPKSPGNQPPPPVVAAPAPPIAATPAPASRAEPASADRSRSCSIELSPGCIRPVPGEGLIINRTYLLQQLPNSVAMREKGLVMFGMNSRLQAVSNQDQGHCVIKWNNGWYLHAYRPVYVSGQKYDRGEAFALDQTTTLILGRDGWPLTVRLSSTVFTQ